MKVFFLLPLIFLAACGTSVKDCSDATLAVNAATIASLAADKNAANNPQSSNMQKLAQYAEMARAAAVMNQTNACSGVVK